MSTTVVCTLTSSSNYNKGKRCHGSSWHIHGKCKYTINKPSCIDYHFNYLFSSGVNLYYVYIVDDELLSFVFYFLVYVSNNQMCQRDVAHGFFFKYFEIDFKQYSLYV